MSKIVEISNEFYDERRKKRFSTCSCPGLILV